MGASLSVTCKSKKAAYQLGAFLGPNLRPFSEVCDEAPKALRDEFQAIFKKGLPSRSKSGHEPTRDVWLGYQIAYGGSPTKIGFNFCVMGTFEIYMKAVLSWAALRVGRRRGLNELGFVGKAHQRVAYYCYDGSPYPVLLADDMKDWDETSREYGRRHWEVTPLGLRVCIDPNSLGGQSSSEYERGVAVRAQTWQRILAALTEQEMLRLQSLWNEEEG